jgi:hypothetical protein
MVALAGAKQVFDVTKELGLLESIKNRLFGAPSEAQTKLADILAQIHSFYAALNGEVVNYFALEFASQEPNAVKKTLLTLTSGEIEARLEMARFHCSKIEPVYRKYLQPLFHTDEGQALDDYFVYKVLDADAWVVQAITEVATWLAAHAKSTLDLYEQGKLSEAASELRQARSEFAEIQEALRDAMKVLINLQIGLQQHRGG